MAEMNRKLLKRLLKERLTNSDCYPADRIAFQAVLDRAAELAAAVVDELAPPLFRRKDPPEAMERKRQRLLNALDGGPLTGAEAGQRAGLTPGEHAHLLRTTPGIIQGEDRRWRRIQGRAAECQTGHTSNAGTAAASAGLSSR